MEVYYTYNPPRHKGLYLDPRTKILFMAFITTLMFFVYENILMDAVVALIAFVLLLTNGQLRIALIYGGLFIAAITAKLLQGGVDFPFWANMVSVLLVALIIRLFPIFMLGYYIVKSTKTNEFIAAMNVWHVPEALIIPMSVIFRFIPTLSEENRAIKNAMKMREIKFGAKKFWENPTIILEYKVIPLIMSIVKIGDELSAAALTRGLGGLKNRTCLVEIKFSIYDVFIVMLSIALLIWAVI